MIHNHPFVTSGIRIGAPAVTTRGFKEKDCLQVVKWIDRIMSDPENETTITEVRSEVNAYMADFPLY